MNYLLRNIPDDLWNKFKSKCASQGKTMLSVILEFIVNYVKD